MPQSAPLERHPIPERAALLPANPEPIHAHTALVTAGIRLFLKPDLNPYPRSCPIPTHPLAAPPRTSLYAQALHVGKAKEKLQHYRRRSPEASPLYQIVYHSRDDLSIQWESRFQAHYGCLRDEVVKTFDEYLNCGLLAHGAARVYCDGCKHSLLIAFSCKRRGVCPSCGAKRAVKFAEHIYSEVIEDAPHRHTVFTIPKRIRVFFKYDRKLNTILFRAAWGALSQVLGIDERELAAIFTVQTAGEALNYHPHLHGLLADGYCKDGVFTRFEELELKAIEEAFAERVLAQLHKQELITDDDVAQILSQDHLLWCRATLDLTDSSAQQAKTTQKNKPVQSCPVPVELLADLSTANNNIGASAVFDAENIKKELDGLIVKLNSRNK